MMPRITLTNMLAASSLCFAAAAAADSKEADPLFASHDILEAQIEAPFAMLVKERPDEDESPGKFSYVDQGDRIELDVGIRTRGRLRRGKETCSFPPFRLNFKKSQVKDTLFHKQDKLKLVTHCQRKSRPYQQSLIAEYLAYRIFNLLTDTSFDVRLLNATYAHTDRKRETQSYAILIENKDRLGKRLDAKPLDTERVAVSSIRPADMNLTSVFQYFLGNTDFSAIASVPEKDCCHNQVIFAVEGALSYTVPYDFDQSGFVDAPHAQPNPRFRLRSSRERLYRGRCVNNEQLPASLQRFRERRNDIEALIRNQPGLEPKTVRSMLSFISDFYATIDDPDKVNRVFLRKCLGASR